MWEINSYQAGSAVEEVQLFLTILTNGVIDKRVLGLWRSQVSECTTVLAILSTASLFVSGGSACLNRISTLIHILCTKCSPS